MFFLSQLFLFIKYHQISKMFLYTDSKWILLFCLTILFFYVIKSFFLKTSIKKALILWWRSSFEPFNLRNWIVILKRRKAFIFLKILFKNCLVLNFGIKKTTWHCHYWWCRHIIIFCFLRKARSNLEHLFSSLR